MNSWIRIGLALILGFLSAIVASLANGRDLLDALQAGFGFAMLVGIIVAVLSFGMDMAVEKGYPGWLGFLLALTLNFLGLIILALLPAQKPVPNRPSSK